MRTTAVIASLLFSAIAARAGDVSQSQVIWDSPSKDHGGTMPLGNGDIGLNAWVEPSGDLIFYISKTDAWDDNSRLCKVGRVRVALDPAPPVTPFQQTLELDSGTMSVAYGDGTKLRLWVDANHPVIHVEALGAHPFTATTSVELWRTETRTLARHEPSDVLSQHPANPPMIIEPDTVIAGLTDRVGWYHHNIRSIGPAEQAAVQGMTDFPRQDPLLHRTFGAMITSPGKVARPDDTRLRSPADTSHRFDIHVLTRHPAEPPEWRRAMDDQIAATSAKPFPERRAAHEAWWSAFWNRSWIQATTRTPTSPVPLNEFPLKIGEDQKGGTKFADEIRGVARTGDFRGDFTLSGEVNPRRGATGRIFDKISVGGSDGFLLDVLPGNQLRLIVGGAHVTVPGVLVAGRWSTVMLTAAAGRVSASVDGREVLVLDPRDAPDDAAHISQMFALQRFITACGGRGAYPIKFNGSIFTVPHEGDPDYRRWGPGYWWQNTRLPYISMCANGDFDLLEPLFAMYADRLLPLNLHRTRKYFGFDNAAYYIECIQFWGDVMSQVYGWTPVDQRKDPLQESGWHKWEWVAGPELVWMMIEAYEHTGDDALLQKRILPVADAVVRFFDQYYKTGADGKLVMHPAMACETWWDCTNPMPELAGLRAILGKLTALPPGRVPEETLAYWKTFAAKLPPLPTREVAGGLRALAPAERFAQKRNSENPELYAVFPFRLCSFDQENRDLGIQALKHQWDRGHTGWRQDDIFMAYLGQTSDARRNLTARARTSDKGSRFPAFWGPNYDWIPDQDHGGVLMKAFQAMLMQTDGRKIFLLPAWPPEWDVDFKLHAPDRTTVEGRVRGGKVEQLKVVPDSRRADVIVVPAR